MTNDNRKEPMEWSEHSIALADMRAVLHYNARTGIFTSLVRRGRCMPGDVVGSPTAQGYLEMSINKRKYLAHRLAIFMVTGAWPDEVDHRDGVRTNNAWVNLRAKDHTFNQQNIRKAKKSNGSGVLGAFKVGNRFKSSIRVDGRVIHLGYFDTAEAAGSAYISAKRVHHPGCTI